MTKDSDQTAVGIGTGVHQYYSRYIDNADAKIGSLLTLDVAGMAALLASLPDDNLALAAAALAVASIVFSIAACLHGIFPRLPSGGDSPIFWEDVRLWASADAYANHVAALDALGVEKIWAINNFHVAGVLHRKFQDIQLAIVSSGVALIAAGASLVLR